MNYKYPYTDFNEYNLDWLITRIKELTEQWAAYKAQMDSDWLAYQTNLNSEWGAVKADWQLMKSDLEELKAFITSYFDNLDVQQEINNKIDEMAVDGSLLALIKNTVEAKTITTTEAWLTSNVHPETGYVIDDSLTISGAAADAKVTGDHIKNVHNEVLNLSEIMAKDILDRTDIALTVATENVAVNQTGYATEKAGYFSSQFIDVGDHDTFVTDFNIGYIDINIASVGFYTTNSFGHMVGYIEQTEQNAIYQIPEEARYICFTGILNEDCNISLLKSIIPALEEAEQKLNDIVWDVPKKRQLYNNADPDFFNGYCDGIKFHSSSNHKIVYIPCKPFTFYTISADSDLWVTNGVYQSQYEPGNNVDAHSFSAAADAETVVIDGRKYITNQTDGTANYLSVIYYNSGVQQQETEDRVRSTLMIAEGSDKTIFYPFEEETKVKESVLPDIIEGATVYDQNIYGSRNALEDGDSIEFSTPNIKKNNLLTFSANITNFGLLTIGQGRNKLNQTAYIVIDDTHVKVYRYTTEPVEWITLTHNLDIQDYIFVTIEVSNTEIGWAKLIITSNGETYTYNRMAWLGCGDSAYAEVTSGSLTNCVLQHSCTDYDKNIWMLGDSYFDHWTTYSLQAGFNNFLCDGYSGRKAAQALSSLDKLLQHGKPSHIVWCMGMNDGDSGSAVNAEWLEAFYNLAALCENRNIKLIPCTIPNTPVVNNAFKNSIIRSSPYQYIDLAKAVGSDISDSWYTGLLSSDNVHPSQLGDQMIARFMETAIPQIFN